MSYLSLPLPIGICKNQNPHNNAQNPFKTLPSVQNSDCKLLRKHSNPRLLKKNKNKTKQNTKIVDINSYNVPGPYPGLWQALELRAGDFQLVHLKRAQTLTLWAPILMQILTKSISESLHRCTKVREMRNWHAVDGGGCSTTVAEVEGTVQAMASKRWWTSRKKRFSREMMGGCNPSKLQHKPIICSYFRSVLIEPKKNYKFLW